MKSQVKRLYLAGFDSLLLACVLAAVALAMLLHLSNSASAGYATRNSAQEHRSTRGLFSYQIGVTVCEQTENPVLNPGFEDGIGWQNHWNCGGDCLCQVDEPGRNSGQSARIFASGTQTDKCKLFTPTSEWISVEPGSHYDYATWIKSNLLQGNAYLRVRFADENHDYVDSAISTVVTDTDDDWVHVTGSVTVPLEARLARMEATVSESGIGSAWFDDVFLGLATCLDITKQGDPDSVPPNQPLTYTIAYENTGREIATNVRITDTLDDYVVFDHADPEAWQRGNDLLWEIGDLLPEDDGTITVFVRVKGEVADTERARLINYAQIVADELDENKCPPYATATTVITDGNGCALTLIPLKQEKSVEPGKTIPYTLLVENTGVCTGTVQVTGVSSLGWPIEPPAPFSLQAGISATVNVNLQVPPCELAGKRDTTTITATLDCDTPCDKTVTQTTAVTTTVEHVYDVNIEPPRSDTVSPGDVVLFAHSVSNAGNYTDTFDITVHSDWDRSLLPSTPLTLGPCGAPDRSAKVTLFVTVPSTADLGTQETIYVTATSQSDATAGASVEDRISVNGGCKLLVDVDEPEDLGLPDDAVTYTLTAWNAGLLEGDLAIAAGSSRGWEIITPPTGTLAAGESVQLAVSLIVSPCEDYLLRDFTTITATLSCSASSVEETESVTTTVDQGSVARIEPNHTQFVSESGAVTFDHTLRNIGNQDDTFHFDVTSVSAWPVDHPESQFAEACSEPQNVPLEVTIPSQTGHFSDTITIGAVPQRQFSRSDSAFDRIRDGRVFLPVVMESYYSPLFNGDFEMCAPAGWELLGPVTVISEKLDSCSKIQGCFARLGERDMLDGSDIPPGPAILSRRVFVPTGSTPRLEFGHCMYSYDRKKYDRLEVAVNSLNSVKWDTGNPATWVPGTELWSSPPDDFDPGVVDLTEYAGQEITLYFVLRYDGSCNSWAYIDNIEIVP
jgi:uncharacterized repeat protein (TIGR01451 family)